MFFHCISFYVCMDESFWHILKIVIKFICTQLCLSPLDVSFLIMLKMALRKQSFFAEITLGLRGRFLSRMRKDWLATSPRNTKRRARLDCPYGIPQVRRSGFLKIIASDKMIKFENNMGICRIHRDVEYPQCWYDHKSCFSRSNWSQYVRKI